MVTVLRGHPAQYVHVRRRLLMRRPGEAMIRERHPLGCVRFLCFPASQKINGHNHCELEFVLEGRGGSILCSDLGQVPSKSPTNLPMYSQSAPPSACVSMVCVFRWSPTGLTNTCRYRPFLSLLMLSCCATWVRTLWLMSHALVDESRVCISLGAEDETVSWEERLVDERGLFSCS